MRNDIWRRTSRIGMILNLIIIIIFVYLLRDSPEELVPAVFLITITLTLLILISNKPRKNEGNNEVTHNVTDSISVIFGLLFSIIGVLSYLLADKGPIAGIIGGSLGIIVLSFSLKPGDLFKTKKPHKKILKGVFIFLLILFNLYVVMNAYQS